MHETVWVGEEQIKGDQLDLPNWTGDDMPRFSQHTFIHKESGNHETAVLLLFSSIAFSLVAVRRVSEREGSHSNDDNRKVHNDNKTKSHNNNHQVVVVVSLRHWASAERQTLSFGLHLHHLIVCS